MPLEPMVDDFDVQVDWEDVPDNDLVPEAVYELLVRKAELGWTRTDKLALEVSYEVGGGELEGKSLRAETFTLGDMLDPKGQLPETRRKVFGWMSLKRLCNACGVRYDQSLRATARELEGSRFLAQVKVVKQPDKNKDGTDNQYAGVEQNRITSYWPIGHTPPASASQALHQGSTGQPHGNGSAQPGPAPRQRLSVQEAMAAQAAEASVSQDVSPGNDDIPF